MDDGLLLAVKLFAAWACLARARRSGEAAKSWRWLGAAYIASALGLVIFGTLQLGFGASFPFPAPSDIAFLAILPLMLAALLSWPSAPERFTSRLRNTLDGLLIAAAALFLAWPFLLEPVMRDSALLPLGKIVSLAYPLGSVATLAVLVFFGARSPGMFRGPFLLVGASVAVLTGANAGYLWLVARGSYRTGHPLDLVFFAGFALGALAALAPLHPAEQSPKPSHRRPRFRLAIPYLPFLACIGVGLWLGWARPDRFSAALAAIGFSLCILMVGRQILALLDVESMVGLLEHKVEERTAALAQSQEELARIKQLQDLSDLAAGVAHDFKNLLGASLGHLEILEEDPSLLPDQRSRAQRALDPLIRAVDLARRLLTLGRSGEERPERLDLAAWLSAQRAHWRGLLPEGCSLSLDLEPCGAVAVDPLQLERVVQNLLVNGSEAVSGRGEIALACHPSPEGAVIEVSDRGPGLAPEVKARLFEPFLTTKPDGTGLGLATAWAILRRAGGRIEAADNPGGGALFRVHLPAA